MTLPASGTITWDMIRAEFGGSTPINISDYYRGGARVPNTPTNANIPTSGQIAASQFYGASAAIPYTPTVQVITTVGSGTITVPTGATSVRIGVWGGGQKGGGAARFGTTGGYGGNGGSYAESLYSCSGGQTINYSVGAGGSGGTFSAMVIGVASTASSGSLSITTLSAPGGGGAAPSGGNVANISGNAGSPNDNDIGGNGGEGILRNIGGTNYSYGSGGAGAIADGGSANMPGDPGAPGGAVFYFT